MGFCRQKLHWNVQNNWSSIIFSDETKIMLGRNGKVSFSIMLRSGLCGGQRRVRIPFSSFHWFARKETWHGALSSWKIQGLSEKCPTTTHYIRSLYDSIPRRIRCVLRSRGQITKYSSFKERKLLLLHEMLRCKFQFSVKMFIWEFFIEIYFFCVSKYQLINFFKLPENRYLAINIERRKNRTAYLRRTSSCII
jgi:hypothetical protein